MNSLNSKLRLLFARYPTSKFAEIGTDSLFSTSKLIPPKTNIWSRVIQLNWKKPNQSISDITLRTQIKSLPSTLREGLRYRIRLIRRFNEIIDQLKNHVELNDDFLINYEYYYNKVAKHTKILSHPLPDPTWGLKEQFGLLSEQQARSHLISEGEFIVYGLEREIKVIMLFGPENKQ